MEGIGVMRRLAAQDLVHHHADGVEVGARVHLLALHLLGREVRRRAEQGPLLGDRRSDAGAAREAEVEDRRTPALVHQHVRRLEVAVHDARVVHARERLEKCVDRVGDRAPPLTGRAAGERRPADELHHDELAVGVDAFVEEADHAGEAQEAQRRQLAPRARPALLDGAEEDLHRDFVCAEQVFGAEHLAGSAAADAGAQCVASGDDAADSAEVLAHRTTEAGRHQFGRRPVRRPRLLGVGHEAGD